MSITTYTIIWGLTALSGWVIWLFIWKFNNKEQHWGEGLLWTMGLAWLFGSGFWPVALPVLVVVVIGYLLYRWVIK